MSKTNALLLGITLAVLTQFAAWCLSQTIDVHATSSPSPTPWADGPRFELERGIYTLNVKGGHGYLSAKEWETMIKTDPVLRFIDAVYTRARKDPEWHKDYVMAEYRAFGREATAYVEGKYHK